MKYIHISTNASLPALLSPRIPAGTAGIPAAPGYTENPIKMKGKFPEPAIARICVSPDIPSCFAAVYPNVSSFFEEENVSMMQFTVYSILPYPNAKIVKPEELTQNKFVLDAHVTKEHWILGKATSQAICVVEITPDVKGDFIKFFPFNNTALAQQELSPLNLKIKEVVQ